jgi:excisionase family DNA binding protein
MKEGNGLEWITKAEAVSLTKISLRTMEREISLGNIRTKQRRQVGRRSVTVLHPEDVERLRKDFTPLSAAEADSDGEQQSSQLPTLKGQSVSLAALLDYMRPLIAGKPAFLPVKEAAEYIGLPEGYLRRCIKEGTLKPINYGGYYIRLVDLHRL